MSTWQSQPERDWFPPNRTGDRLFRKALSEWRSQKRSGTGERRTSNVGDKWEDNGVGYTVNPTDDENAPGGYYLSQKDTQTGDHATAVYNTDGTFAETKANRQWRNVPRQD